MSSSHRRSTRRTHIAVAFAGLAVVVTTTVVGFSARDDEHRERAAAQTVELIAIRAAVRRSLLDDVNTQMLAQFDVASSADVAAAAEDRLGRLRNAGEQLDELADADDAGIRNEALALIAVIARDELQVEREADPIFLYDWSWDVLLEGAPVAGQAPDDVLALADLMAADSAGALVLNDALDAAYTMFGPEVPGHMAEYVSRSEPYIRDGAGYLGPDRDTPLTDSVVFIPVVEPVRPEVAEIEARVAASRLWEYDAWTRSWPDGDPGDPPITLGELSREAGEVDADARAIVDATLAGVRDAHDRSADAATRIVLIMFAVAGAVLTSLTAAAGVAGRRRWRSIRRAAAQGETDPLTSVANRYRLDHLERMITGSPDDVHVVVAVDIDGFKHVNDRFGHRGGDAFLVELARRLQHVVDRRTRTTGVAGSVVRMGGDEFILTLHSGPDVDADALRLDLDAIRTSSIEIDDELVTLRFSTGLAYARGAATLQELLDAADLACYDDKARRRPAANDRHGATGLQRITD